MNLLLKPSNRLKCRECNKTLAVDKSEDGRFSIHEEGDVDLADSVAIMCPKCKKINLISRRKTLENGQNDEYSYFEAGVVSGL